MTAQLTHGLTYMPGVKQHIVITITDPDQHRWGFQSTIRPASNPRAAEAGFFTSTDGNTQVVCQDNSQSSGKACPDSPGFQWVEHTSEGTRNGTSSPVNFEFDWTPPAQDLGDLTFYIAANAANGDGTPDGDHLYYLNLTIQRASPGDGPQITRVADAASFTNVIVPGSWIAITGSKLASSTRTWRGDEIVNGQLPDHLDDVTVSINGRRAYLEYISPTQINAQAPSDDTAGSVQVQVTNAQGTSAVAFVQLQPVSPELFTWNTKYAVAQHADYSLLGPDGLFPGAITTPARPGESIILYGTGFGATNPAVPAGQVVVQTAVLTDPITVSIGGQMASVAFAGLVPGTVGLYQINLQVPDAVSDGESPVVIQYRSAQTSASAVLAVKR